MTTAAEPDSPEAIAAPSATEQPSPALGRVILRRAGVVLALAITFAISLFLYTRNNDGPPWYHPDEAGKAYQVIDGRYRNFNHPLLLLEASELMTRIRHPELDVPRAEAPEHMRDPNPYSAWGLLPE